MYAIVRTSGKQYRVAAGDVIVLDHHLGKEGETVELSDVLMVGDGDKVEVGTPLVAKACVRAEVLEQGRAEKVLVFKRKRRQGYMRKNGHRQDKTVLKIAEIQTASGVSKAPAAAKKAAQPKAAPKEEVKAEKTASAKKETKAAASKTEKKAPAAPKKKAAPAKKDAK